MDIDCSFIDYSFINFTGTESLLTTSQYAKVIFHDIQEKYSLDEDLVCQYSLTDKFTAEPGDRIVLFRLGWQDITDYVLFEWATVPKENESLQIMFKADSLPKDLSEFYQLCYISSENAVCGASVPFQFICMVKNLITTLVSDCFETGQSKYATIPDYRSTINGQSCSYEVDSLLKTEVSISVTDSVLDIVELKEENKLLKQDLIKTATTLQHYNAQIIDLKTEVESLRNNLKATQSDVADLKMRMDMATAEYKKLYVEKIKMERKYDKLVRKCQNKNKKSVETDSELSYDGLGELEPLPPFPLLL